MATAVPVRVMHINRLFVSIVFNHFVRIYLYVFSQPRPLATLQVKLTVVHVVQWARLPNTKEGLAREITFTI